MLRHKEKFLDQSHKDNFERLKNKWNEIEYCPKYRAACYILSTPSVFNTVKKDLSKFKHPTDWIYNYLEKGNPGKYNLNEQIIQLGKLSLSLCGEYKDFNLDECFDTLTDIYYELLKQAMDIRRKFKVKTRYDLEDYLDGEKHIYINKHRLTVEEIKALLLLFPGNKEN